MATFQKVKLGDVVSVKGGKRLPLGHELIKDRTGHPYIRARDIGGGKITFDDPVYVDDNTFPFIKKYIVNKNDVCITIVGANVGDIGFVPAHLDGASLTENAVKLFPKNNDYDGIFLKYCLLTHEIKLQMNQLAGGGAAQPKLGLYKINDLEIPCPAIVIQKRIASVLSAYDELIENNEKRIKALEEMAQLLYAEWFVKFKFSGHEKVKMVDSGTEYGLIPEGWEAKYTEECFDILGGGTPSRNDPSNWSNGNINWFTPTDITRSSQMFLDESSEKITESGLKTSSAKVFQSYSIMLTSRATIGAISINTAIASTNQGFIVCVPNSKMPLYYLYYWLRSKVPAFCDLASGATFKELSKGTFKKIRILSPSIATLKEFEIRVEPLAKLILALQRQLRNLAEARDLLIPQLVTGKRELK